MKKKNTNKNSHNKWKIVAIISLVINALVVLFLTIGLATPKAKYQSVSAYSSNYGSYNIYEQSPYLHKFNALDNSFTLFDDLSSNDFFSVSRWRDSSNLKRLDIVFTQDNYIDPYLNQGVPFVRELHMSFKGIQDPSQHSGTSFYLQNVTIYPNSSGYYYSVLDASWDYNSSVNPSTLVNYSVTYQNLGFDSSYALISNGFNALNSHLSRIFYNRGSNAIIDEYLITDNFNPNKYVSLSMDSIGMLYNPPDMFGSNLSDTTSGVTWFEPTYRGVENNQKVSTLGCLQIPLLFTSNGDNFLGIRFYFDVVQSYVGTDNEVHYLDYGNSIQLKNFHYTFVYMSYYYEYLQGLGTVPHNIKEKVVCAVPVYTISADFIQHDAQYRNYTYEPFKPYNWLSNEYKKISVYGASQSQLNKVGISMPVNSRTLAINNLTIKEILLYDMSVNPGNINTGGGNIGNVFSLIRLAFDSLTGILAISIVPGITIGIMLFLPLVLTIIIVIIKLVKR